MTSAAQHIKARQILSSIEAARTQKEQNDGLRNTLLDVEDTLVELYNQLFSRKLHSSIQMLQAEADERLNTFEGSLSYSHTCKRRPVQRYMEDCHLVLPREELSLTEAEGNPRAVEVLMPLRASLAGEKMPASVAGGDTTAAGLAVDRFKLLTTRCEQLIEAARLDTTEWVPVAQHVAEVVQNVEVSRPIERSLSVLDDQISLLAQNCAKLEADERASYESGDVAQNEAVMTHRITLMEGITDLITQKFHLIEEERVQILGGHSGDIQATTRRLEAFVVGYRESVVRQREAIERDIAALEESVQRTDADNVAAQSSYEASRDASNRRLVENAAQQQEKWEQIHALERDIAALAAARREEVDRRVKLAEKEERRAIEVRNFAEFVHEHHTLLTEMSRVCEARELLGDMLHETCLLTCRVAEARVQNAVDFIAGLESKAHTEHYERFREHYMLLGKLQYMKERMLDEYVQKAQVAQGLQELAMDTYNPKAREFALEKQAIEERIAAITAELEVLRRKADLYVEAFKPTEHALRQASKVFTHPVQELAAINTARGKRVAQFHALNAGGFNDPSNARIDTSAAVLANERLAAADTPPKLRRAPTSNID